MTWYILFNILNSLFRVAVMGMTVVALTKYREMFNRAERLGLSIAGGCSFLTVGVIWERTASPFDGWASMLFTFGVLLFLCGLLWRKGRHYRANGTGREEARRYLESRGKI